MANKSLFFSTIVKSAKKPKNISTALSKTALVVKKVAGKPQSEEQTPSFEDAIAVAKQLEDLLQKKDDLQNKVKEKFNSWRNSRQDLISSLNSLAKNLHEVHLAINVTTLTGSIFGVVGGGATIAGLVLAPFTMGTSLVLTVGGATVSAAGGVVSLTATLSEMGITKSRCDEATDKIKEDNSKTNELKDLIEKYEETNVKINKICKEKADALEIVLATILSGTTFVAAAYAVKGVCTGMKTAKAIKTNAEMAKRAMELTRLSKLARSSVRDVKNVKQLFQGSAAALSKTGRLVSGVFSVVFIGLDIWSIVTTSQDIDKGSKSQAGKSLQEKADALQREVAEMDKILKPLL